MRDLRKLIASSSANHLPIENLRLILRGKVLEDAQDDDDPDDVYVQLSNGGNINISLFNLDDMSFQFEFGS